MPVPALVAQLRRQVGGEAASFVHWGATSQDILDTALVLQLREALALLDAAARRGDRGPGHGSRTSTAPRRSSAGRASSRRCPPRSGSRSPAGWRRCCAIATGCVELTPRLLVVQLGGAAGNLVAIGERGRRGHGGTGRRAWSWAARPCPGTASATASAELASWLTLVTGSLGKLGLRRAAPGPERGRRGARGGGRRLVDHAAEVEPDPGRGAGHAGAPQRDAARRACTRRLLHAHERDGASWQLEWVILPDMVSALRRRWRMRTRSRGPWSSMSARMAAVLAATRGLPLAEAASFELAAHLPRAEAQKLVKAACAEVLATDRDLLAILAERAAVPADRLAGRAPPGGAPRLRGDVDRSRAGRGAPRKRLTRPQRATAAVPASMARGASPAFLRPAQPSGNGTGSHPDAGARAVSATAGREFPTGMVPGSTTRSARRDGRSPGRCSAARRRYARRRRRSPRRASPSRWATAAGPGRSARPAKRRKRAADAVGTARRDRPAAGVGLRRADCRPRAAADRYPQGPIRGRRRPRPCPIWRWAASRTTPSNDRAARRSLPAHPPRTAAAPEGAAQAHDSSGGVGGADRDRTDDLLNAIQALSQLSYGPSGLCRVDREDGPPAQETTWPGRVPSVPPRRGRSR